jgi:aspartyl protease family protein
MICDWEAFSMRRNAWLWVAGAIGATGLLIYFLADSFPNALGERDQISLVAYLGWLVLLLGSLIMHVRHRPIAALRNIAIWAAVFIVLVGGYSYRQELEGAWMDVRARITGELVPERGTEIGVDGIRFNAGRDGHFHVEAQVDGAPVSFVVDTGASDIVLTPDDARRLGFDPAQLNYSRAYETANGIVYAAPVRLNEVVVGPIRLENVIASVNQAPLSTSLLGMSFLKRLEGGYEVRNDTLTLWR